MKKISLIFLSLCLILTILILGLLLMQEYESYKQAENDCEYLISKNDCSYEVCVVGKYPSDNQAEVVGKCYLSKERRLIDTKRNGDENE